MSLRALAVVLSVGLAAVAGCAAQHEEPIDGLVGAEEPDDDADLRGAESVAETLSAGAQLRTNAALNLRASASKSATILEVMPEGTLVTAVTGKPSAGWYQVKHGAKTGWAYGVYLDRVTTSGGTTPAGGSCSPARAIGIVSAPKKALLDTIAYAEGTRGYSQDGYDVMFSFKTFASCDGHPRKTICSGGYCSTAAGRYQFLSTTWDGLKLPNFRPENQTTGAMTLIAWRKATIPADRALTATEFTNVMNKISYEWASLPPGRYGQPIKTMSQLRTEYCKLAKC
ncbi:MAG: SH3 domain-containing protein [Myxococcales bacterium]|nr:SH3 domain-containing protein [Myxococcales bacterium]